VLSDEVGRILSVEPPVSRVDGLIALLAPERTDRRGERNVRLGRVRHVERALRAKADRRDRPLARTTTRRRALPPWSSREGRGSRGVGVHRSFREGPDWPALPRPSDGPVVLRRHLPFLARPHRVRAPALLGQPSAHSIAEPMSWSSLRFLLSRAWGRAQEAERERSDPTPSSTRPQGIVYHIVWMSHCTGYGYNLVHKMPCPQSRVAVG
jgi:hypothetical protein